MAKPRSRLLAFLSCLLLWSLFGSPLAPFEARAAADVNPLVAAEAFYDDPGLAPGTGTSLTLGGDEGEVARTAEGAVDPGGAELGAHTLYVRFRDQAGVWSPPLGQTSVLSSTTPGGPSPGGAIRLVAAEAFVDQDPGQGRGVPLDQVADGAIDSAMEVLGSNAAITGLVPGPPVLNLRFLDSAGVWSAPIRQSFYVAPGTTTPGSGPTYLVAAAGLLPCRRMTGPSVISSRRRRWTSPWGRVITARSSASRTVWGSGALSTHLPAIAVRPYPSAGAWGMPPPVPSWRGSRSARAASRPSPMRAAISPWPGCPAVPWWSRSASAAMRPINACSTLRWAAGWRSD